MATFRVWAPTAKVVEIDIAGQRTSMQAEGDGWWFGEVSEAGEGTDYAFILDGGEPLPDPRSPWQPDGIHGRSRIVNHATYPWTDQHWQAPPLSSAIVYELHTGTFTREGTFEAAIGKLDHLVELGVTHLELMPVNEFPGARGWGYDGVDLYAPHHAYGGPAGLKKLVDGCHARGLAVLLDVVYNHLGPTGNYLGRFGPYFTKRYATPWGEAINFDDRYSDEVRRFLCDNAVMWLRDYHFDGLRIDAVHAILDTCAVHFLEQLAEQVEALEAELGRRLFLIAESDLNTPRLVQAKEAGGYGLDAQWSDDFHHALHALLTGEREGYYADFGTIAQVAKALRQAYVYDGCYSRYRRRRHGRPAAGLSGHCFLGYLQNHDQVGNRATGQRSSHLMSTGRLKLGAALVLTSPFVPMLFQGEEWGASAPFQYFTNHEDPRLGRAVREGRRSEFAAFGWKPEEVPDPQSVETFNRSKLDWSEIEHEPHTGLLAWHRRMIALRRRCPDLTDGRMDRVAVRFDEQSRWLTVERGCIAVCCNLADEQQVIPLSSAGAQTPLLLSAEAIRIDGKGVLLPPDSVAVLGPAGLAQV